MTERLYNILLVVLAVLFILFMVASRHAKADMTTTTVTPQSTVTITQTPTQTITTITTPSTHIPSPAVPAPLTGRETVPEKFTAPVPFMAPPAAPVPQTAPFPKAAPQKPSIYPRYRNNNDCNCGPDPSSYYPRVPADRVLRSTDSCNGVGCY